jgi:hypothetical protein
VNGREHVKDLRRDNIFKMDVKEIGRENVD